MSSMWNVSVINKGKDWVDLEVVLAHPDAGGFPDDPVFALCLLTNEAYKFNDEYKREPACSLGRAIEHDKSYQPFDVAPRVHEFVKSLVVYEVMRIPFDEDDAHAKVDEEVLAMGVEKDSKEWEDEWHEKWRDFWDDKNNMPLAKYRINVTDPKWIEHLTVGQSFDTASYSESGPWIDEERVIDLDTPADAEGHQGVPGFKDSHLPPRANTMNRELIHSLAESNLPLSAEAVKETIAEHLIFLDTGGRGGQFTRLEVSGMPLNVYSETADAGTQLELRMKKLAMGTDLSNADLSNCDLSGVIAEGVNFSGAKMDGSILTDGFFRGANFDGVSLRDVDMTGADFRNASFKGADLKGADFEICDCEGADFRGAKIANALFTGANLTGIRH